MELKFPSACCDFRSLGEDLRAGLELIQELLLLTCMGTLVAGITYAGVILLN